MDRLEPQAGLGRKRIFRLPQLAFRGSDRTRLIFDLHVVVSNMAIRKIIGDLLIARVQQIGSVRRSRGDISKGRVPKTKVRRVMP